MLANERLNRSIKEALRLHSGNLEKESCRGPGWVYLVRVNNFFKIGIAANVKLRVSQMQVGCPYDMELVQTWHCINPCANEESLHRMLSPWHVRGEWFELPKEVLCRLRESENLNRFSLNEPEQEAVEVPTPRYGII